MIQHPRRGCTRRAHTSMRSLNARAVALACVNDRLRLHRATDLFRQVSAAHTIWTEYDPSGSPLLDLEADVVAEELNPIREYEVFDSTETPIDPGTGLETRFVHGGPDDTGHWQVLEDSGASYVYGNYIDEILNMVRWGSSVYYHQDEQFSVVALTAGPGGVTTYGGQFIAQGAVIERIWYGDYGKPIPTGIYSSPVGNRFCFTGREWDGETELAYYRTRYLDPMWGRFTTRDFPGPWHDPGAVGNASAYAGSNPASSVDAYGFQQAVPIRPPARQPRRPNTDPGRPIPFPQPGQPSTEPGSPPQRGPAYSPTPTPTTIPTENEEARKFEEWREWRRLTGPGFRPLTIGADPNDPNNKNEPVSQPEHWPIMSWDSEACRAAKASGNAFDRTTGGACSGPISGCNENMAPGEMTMRKFGYEGCALANDRINDACHEGGNENHKGRANAYRKAAEECARMIRSANKKGKDCGPRR